MLDQVMCTSFIFFMLYDLGKKHRPIPSGYAYDDNMPLSAKWLNKLMGLNMIGKWVHSNVVCSEYTLIDEDTVRKFHKWNMKIGSFTLYPLIPGEMPDAKKAQFSREEKRLAALDIDWIETDQPELARKDLY